MATNDGPGVGRMGNPLPTQFGRYQVLKSLGDGGMGSVYLVLNTDLQREEALKVPHFEAGTEADMRERFLRKARAAAGLDHPNLCQVYDVGERDGICYLTMRYLKGRLLSDFTGAPQPPRKAVEIVTKLAQALAAAHAKGVTHRDLKPANVMMCPGVGPVVMDFGLAKQTQQREEGGRPALREDGMDFGLAKQTQQRGRKLTRMGAIMGTPDYMPPEQVKGDLTKLGPTSDVYSLGVILFELLTARLPFAAATDAETYAAVLFNEAPAPSSLRPGLSPALDAICRKAMAKAPEGRHQTMKALAAELMEYLEATPPTQGSGELLGTKGGTTDVYQMATGAPGPSKPSTVAPRSRAPSGSKPPPPSKAPPPPTPRPKAPITAAQHGGKAPSSIRPPTGPRRSASRVAAPSRMDASEKEGGRLSVVVLIGAVLCFLLLVGGVGGVGALVYVLNQKKPDDSAARVAVTTPQPTPHLTPIDDAPPPPPPEPPPPAPAAGTAAAGGEAAGTAAAGGEAAGTAAAGGEAAGPRRPVLRGFQGRGKGCPAEGLGRRLVDRAKG